MERTEAQTILRPQGLALLHSRMASNAGIAGSRRDDSDPYLASSIAS